MITIDGAAGEGGGQVLRTSLSLALCTGQAFRIDNIRAGRERPGLMRQHLTAVEAACAVGAADCDGAAIGSGTLAFRPGPVRPGEYRFAVGTAGSATLVLQTVLPPLLTASGPSRLVLEGGTHNPHAPPFEFLDQTFLAQLNRMGPRVTATLERPGFYPAGGGRLVVEVAPAARLGPLALVDRGDLLGVDAVARVAGLHPDIAAKEIQVARRVLDWDASCFQMEELPAEWGPGNVLLLTARFGAVTEVVAGFGERGVSAHTVAEKAAKRMAGFIASGAAVGPYLADQLLLPLALAGYGEFTTVKPSRHARTNAEVIRQFLGTRVDFIEAADGPWRVEVRG